MKQPDVEREPMEQARLQAMNATQWLARLARSYKSSAADIELRWDHRTGRIVTPEIAPGVAVGMSLPTLVLQFDENGEPSQHPIDVDGKSSTEVEAWILIELLHRGIDRNLFSKSLPYQPRDLMSGEEPKYSPQDLVDELKQLADSFRSAADVLMDAKQSLDPQGDASADLVWWPERMELGFAVPTFGDDHADGSIKIAFTAGDAEDGRPRYVVRRETLESAATESHPALLPLADFTETPSSGVRDALVAEVKAIKTAAAN